MVPDEVPLRDLTSPPSLPEWAWWRSRFRGSARWTRRHVAGARSTEVTFRFLSGQSSRTIWRKQPVFVRNLTPQEIQVANAVPMSELRDPQSLAERTKPGKANWLITMGVCTHLGCIPLGTGEGENRGPFGGYFCPCHGSAYDTAARIRQGPAPRNLDVPEYEFVSDTTVRIG